MKPKGNGRDSRAGSGLRGGRPSKARPARADLELLYVLEARAVRDVDAVLGVSKDMVARALREYGLTARPPAKRSRLRALDQGRLFADLAEFGINRTAEKYGIPRRTFLSYLARVRGKEAKKR